MSKITTALLRDRVDPTLTVGVKRIDASHVRFEITQPTGTEIFDTYVHELMISSAQSALAILNNTSDPNRVRMFCINLDDTHYAVKERTIDKIRLVVGLEIDVKSVSEIMELHEPVKIRFFVRKYKHSGPLKGFLWNMTVSIFDLEEFAQLLSHIEEE